MSQTDTSREAVERLERVSFWDGDRDLCHWCGEDWGTLCINSEPVCSQCRTIAYERALIAENRALRDELDRAERERDEALALLEEIATLGRCDFQKVRNALAAIRARKEKDNE